MYLCWHRSFLMFSISRSLCWVLSWLAARAVLASGELRTLQQQQWAVAVANSVAVAELIAKHRLSGTTQPAQRPLWRIYLCKQQLWHAKTNSRKESSDFSSIVGCGGKAIETKLLHSALHTTSLFGEILQNLSVLFSDKIKFTNIAKKECYLVPAYFMWRWWNFWDAWCKVLVVDAIVHYYIYDQNLTLMGSTYRVLFFTVTPLKSSKYKKVNQG